MRDKNDELLPLLLLGISNVERARHEFGRIYYRVSRLRWTTGGLIWRILRATSPDNIVATCNLHEPRVELIDIYVYIYIRVCLSERMCSNRYLEPNSNIFPGKPGDISSVPLEFVA